MDESVVTSCEMCERKHTVTEVFISMVWVGVFCFGLVWFIWMALGRIVACLTNETWQSHAELISITICLLWVRGCLTFLYLDGRTATNILKFIISTVNYNITSPFAYNCLIKTYIGQYINCLDFNIKIYMLVRQSKWIQFVACRHE